ncbi:MAG: ATP-dependent helicase [Deltaproteobacteria bacterium]|nr:ATP-dependent helicase [Deltaproteobacteria bacterium]
MKYKLVSNTPSNQDDLYKDLDPQQLKAVKSEGVPLLIVAGAGTGKTRTLIRRVGHLIASGAQPSRIMVCTFTQKAGRELVARLNQFLGPISYEIWAGTFHHTGHKLLRKYGKCLNLSSDFSILDREDTIDLLAGILHRRNVSPPLTARKLHKLFSMAIARQQSLAQIIEEKEKDFIPAKDLIIDLFADFSQEKIRQQVVDFDDLLALWKIILTDYPESAEEMISSFDYVLVDEYQDTNRLQADILDLMAQKHQNITVVGDDAQSIYSFRGAYPQNISTFSKRFSKARTVKLETNYRSTQPILNLANFSILNSDEIIPKKLSSHRGNGEIPVLVKARDKHQEAQFIAQRLWELHVESGIPLREIAVLFRTNKQGLEIELELSRRGIPFGVNGGRRIFEQAHFKDFISYIRVQLNPLDTIAVRRLFRLTSGLGYATAEKVIKYARNNTQSDTHILSHPKLHSIFSGKIKHKIKLLGDFFQIQQKLGNRIQQIMTNILQQYKPVLLAKFENSKDRLDELKEFVSLSGQYTDLNKLLSDLGLKTGPIGEKIAEKDKPDEDGVILSTIHQAKGLEWRIVFLTSLYEGGFPLIYSQKDKKSLEEERRIFHVAVTRAKDELYLLQPILSGSSDRGKTFRRTSRYLTELPKDLYLTWEIEVISPN